MAAAWQTVEGLTPELAQEILRKSSSGMPIARAARTCGVSPQRWARWRKFAEQGRAPFEAFFARAQEEESSLVSKALVVVHDALQGETPDPKLACWVLERQMPAEFNPTTRATLKSAMAGLVNALRSEFANEPQIMRRVMTAMRRAQDVDSDEAEVANTTPATLDEDADAAPTH
jgi:hypothetical protein